MALQDIASVIFQQTLLFKLSATKTDIKTELGNILSKTHTSKLSNYYLIE